jgi:hypothetical protein
MCGRRRLFSAMRISNCGFQGLMISRSHDGMMLSNYHFYQVFRFHEHVSFVTCGTLLCLVANLCAVVCSL